MSEALTSQLKIFADARRNGFVKAFTINSSGGRIAGLYGTTIPKELFYAVGMTPVNLYSIDSSNLAAAEEELEPENCALIKASYGYAITGKCPFTHFSDIIIAHTSCPEKFKMIAKLGKFKKIYLLASSENLRQMVSEYQILSQFIEQEFNLKLDRAKLKQINQKFNAINGKLNELITVFMHDPVPLTSYDFYNILYGSQFIFDLAERYDLLAQTVETMKKNSHLHFGRPLKKLLLVGAPVAGLREKILLPLNDYNIKILPISFCEAENYGMTTLGQEPISALAEKYLPKAPLTSLTSLIKKYEIEGIINLNLTGCPHLSLDLAALQLPHLTITTDYYDNDNPPLLRQLTDFIAGI